MRITRITIARLYNLGSYEHERFELTIDLHEGESAQNAIIGLERILAALKPESQWGVRSRSELDRESDRIKNLHAELSKNDEDDFRRRHGYFEGTPAEYIKRLEDSLALEQKKRHEYEAKSATARKLLDDLGGASHWTDAKLDWEIEEIY